MSLQDKQDKGFTVVELLVVIAVIGLLSSIVLVNLDLPKQREKAKVAKSLSFSQSAQNTLGSDAVGIWNFDEGAWGGAIIDSSGYSGNGSLDNGATVAYSSETPHKIVGASQGKYSLSFSGSGNVNIPSNSRFNPTTAGQITITLWFNANTVSGTHYLVSKGTNPEWAFELYQSNSGLAFVIDTLVGGIHSQAVTGQNIISPGKWYFLAAVYKLNDKTTLYLDGAKVAESTAFVGSPGQSVANLLIGNKYAADPSYPFSGYIDDVRIYSSALALGEIQKHYAEELKSLAKSSTFKLEGGNTK